MFKYTYIITVNMRKKKRIKKKCDNDYPRGKSSQREETTHRGIESNTALIVIRKFF